MTEGLLTPSKAASRVITWMRAALGGLEPFVTDLDVVRQMLPETPYGKGVNEIKAPAPATWAGCEGALVRNPGDAREWGIFYNPSSRPERQRFTVAHEIGHFVLHRDRHERFTCEPGAVYSGADTLAVIEREANAFASNLLMPGDIFGRAINGARIDLHFLSDLATRFEVSFEALCIRFIQFTDQRAILVCWDNGFLNYECRSTKARQSRACIRRTDDPQEPLAGTLAADSRLAQEWSGIQMSAAIWCPEEPPHMKLHEFKHSYGERERVLSLLILESAEPRPWDTSWHDEDTEDSYDRFIKNGQYPSR